MKNVIISIKGMQGIDEHQDVIEFTTVGTMEKQGDCYLLRYDESDMIGSSGVNTTLTVNGEHTVIMERTGSMTSKLVISEGVRNNCFYSTPHGDLVIGIFGENIKNRLTDGGGNLEMSYTIDSNLQPVSRNTVEITVRGAEKDVDTCC